MKTIALSKVLFLFLLIFSGWGANAQYFNDSIVIPAGNRNFSWCSASNDYIFVSDHVNDSIYVISICTRSIVASIKTHSNILGVHGKIKFSKNKIIISIDDHSVEMYDALSIYNITYLQTLGGFDQGWLESDPDDTTYFFWMEHWAQKIRIIDFSSGTMVTKCNPSTSGNVQGVSRIGNMVYTSNAYQSSKRIDTTNPTFPILTDFGGPSVHVECTNIYILYNDFFNGDVLSLINQSGTVLASKSPASSGAVTRDNFAFVLDNLTTWKLYNIQSGSFDFLSNVPRSIQYFNDNYWIGQEPSKIVLYPRNTSIQASNITFPNITNNQFTFNWTDGTGAKRAVFIKQDSLGAAAPVNNTTYTASTAFGSGSQIGTTGWYCVFNGTTHSSGVTVTNLSPGITYRVMVCEYNGAAGAEIYNGSTGCNNPQNQQTCSNVIPTEGLIAWYPFNGNANDESGNGHNGTVFGATLTTDRFGGTNKAYSFDGQLNKISAIIGNQQSISISLWYNSLFPIQWYPSLAYLGTTVPQTIEFMGQCGNHPFYQGHEGQIIMFGGSKVSSTYIPTVNQWHHLVGIYEAGTDSIFLYIDGLLNSKGHENSAGLTITDGSIFFGNTLTGQLSDGGAGFLGSIDDIFIYNRSLTDCEITALHEEGDTTMAPLCFNPASNYSTNPHPRNLTSADFNGDTFMDLAIANYEVGSNTISVLLNTGSGTFGTTKTYSTAMGPHGIISADFNGDGKMDLATANRTSNNISILLGDGLGGFGPAVNYNVGTFPQELVTGDFNGDGLLDIAVLGGNIVSILLGSGTGSFSPATNFPTNGNSGNALTSNDFNGDGFLDLAITNNATINVSVLSGTGTGSFGFPNNLPVLNSPTSIISKDFNGDGFIDLAIGDLGNNISIFLGTGSGSFGSASNYASGGIAIWDIISGDFNNDGIIDLATANNSNFISVLLGSGTGSFGISFTFTTNGVASEGILSADFNSDNKMDLACTNNISNNISVFLNCVNNIQATNLTFSNITNNQFTFNWTDGNGTSRAAFIKEGTEGSASPVNNTTYTPNTAFGSGSQIGTTGWYCVFNGTTHPDGITITNLSPCKTYRVMVCEYTGSPGSEIYNTSTAFKNPENVQTSGSVIITTDGLVAWYPFNGNAIDESGNSHNGTVFGATLTQDRFGNTDKAYYFNGVDNRITANIGILPVQAFSFWFKAPEPTTSWPEFLMYNQIWCNTVGFGGNPGDFGKIDVRKQLSQNNGYMVRTTDVPQYNAWHYAYFEYNSSNNLIKFYLDNNFIGNGVYHNDGGFNDLPKDIITFGATTDLLIDHFLTGVLDDIRIYDRTLTETEIQALYREGTYDPIYVTSPNGGERWKVGDIHPITWTSCGVDNVKIEYSINNGTNWTTIINESQAITGSYAWTVPDTPSELCLVKITSTTDGTIFDQSDAVFTIYKETIPQIIVTSPNGGERWKVGDIHQVTWTSSGVDNIKIEYSINSGTNWTTIINETFASAGSYAWTVPNTPSDLCLVKITSIADVAVFDVSDATFVIYVPESVSIVIPNAFTPNGDGYNDTFGPVTKGIGSLEMNINDRNGRFIHKIDSVNGRWDGNMPSGSAAPQGVYFYLLKATGYDNLEYVRQGNVNLYRDLIDLTPNPVKSAAILDLTGRFSGDKTISIYSSSGILVRKFTTMEDVVRLDLSFLNSGLYILKAADQEQVIVVKFIKE